MPPIRSGMLVLLMACAAMPASAQPNAQSNAPPPSPRPPAFIISPNEIYRGPPLPPDRPAIYLYARIGSVLVERLPAMAEGRPEVIAHHFMEAESPGSTFNN